MRAKARALACEMHSGFLDLRNELPMNIRAKRKVTLSHGALKDIARIDAIWSGARGLLSWGVVVWGMVHCRRYVCASGRAALHTGLNWSRGCPCYQQKVLASEPVKRWLKEASIENDIVEKDEAGEAV